jgi:hypothetical protein
LTHLGKHALRATRFGLLNMACNQPNPALRLLHVTTSG